MALWKGIRRTRVKFTRVREAKGYVSRGAVVVTYRTLVVLAVFFCLAGLAAAGFVYARFLSEVRKRESCEALAAHTRALFFELAQQQAEILSHLPPITRKEVDGAVTPVALVRQYGAAAERYTEAEACFREGRFKEALEVIDALLVRDDLEEGMDRKLHLRRVWCVFYLGDMEATLAAAATALEAFPELHEVRHLQVQIQLSQGRGEVAAEDVAALLKMDAGPEALLSRAMLHWQQGRLDAAIADYRTVLGCGRLRLVLAAVNNLALLYAEGKGDFVRARFYATMLLALAPRGFTSLRTAGKVLLLQGERTAAAGLLQQAHAQVPDNAGVRVALSALAVMEGRAEEAENWLPPEGSALRHDRDALVARLREGRSR